MSPFKTTLAAALAASMAASAILSPGLAGAQPGPAPAAGAQSPMAQKATASLIPPADAPPVVTTSPGPYAVTIETSPGLVDHTLYRPAELADFSGDNRLPIIAWGNGACSNAGLLFRTFLTQIASHGFVVIVSGSKDAPLPDFAATAGLSGGAKPLARVVEVEPKMTRDADMIAGLDWAIKENERKDSPYFHRLNPDKVAVMGQSCGGLQAIANAGDPRVKTAVIWNSGTFPDLSNPTSASRATKASLAGFHYPVAYINGGPADIAFQNSLDDISRIDGAPVFFGWINVGHGGTYSHPGGGRFGAVAVAWLKWRLNGDKDAARMFEGPDCGLCKDPVWHVRKKNMS